MNVPLSEILIWICPVQEDFLIQSDDVLSPLTQFSDEVWIPAKSHCLKDLICGSWFSCLHLAKWLMERASSSHRNFQEDWITDCPGMLLFLVFCIFWILGH
jgi:hypothetical protein